MGVTVGGITLGMVHGVKALGVVHRVTGNGDFGQVLEVVGRPVVLEVTGGVEVVGGGIFG